MSLMINNQVWTTCGWFRSQGVGPVAHYFTFMLPILFLSDAQQGLMLFGSERSSVSMPIKGPPSVK